MVVARRRQAEAVPLRVVVELRFDRRHADHPQLREALALAAHHPREREAARQAPEVYKNRAP